LVQAAVGRPQLPDEVSTLGVSSFSQTLLKRLDIGRGWLPLAQESDPVDLPCRLLLRVCRADGPGAERGGRRQERQKHEQADANRDGCVMESTPAIVVTHLYKVPWYGERTARRPRREHRERAVHCSGKFGARV